MTLVSCDAQANSIATVCISGSLEEKLKTIARAGYKAVEIFEPDLITCPRSPREIFRMLQDLDLRCALYQPFRDFEGMPEPTRTRTFDRICRKFDLMRDLECERILVCSNCSPLSSGEIPKICDDFAELGTLAAKWDILVGYEALAWGRHVFDHRQVYEIVQAVNHPSIGIILDSFHSLAREIPVETLDAIDAAKIVFVQLADAPKLTMDYLFWSRHYRCMPGQGELPVNAFVEAILRTGYRGPLSLEIFNDRFRAGSASLVARDGMRSLIALRDRAAGAAGFRPALPKATDLHGVEFIEFAVPDEKARAMLQLISSIGFVRSGTHRTEDVERWTQGSVNLVINRGTRGFARTYLEKHGPGVCAIALRVSDPAATIQRAKQLDIPDHPTAGDGALQVPALEAVGDSILYLLSPDQCSNMWDEHFHPISDTSTEPELATDLDHIAASVEIDEFLSWQLFWNVLFDLTTRTHFESADPLGLVQTRAIESADGRFRMLLHAAEGRDTLTNRFVSRAAGGGIQDIAFRTSSIRTAAEHIRNRGAPILAIPANYFDDLLASGQLSADEVRQLRSLDLLYDQTSNGEYLQLLTRAFEKRFFFEIVERSSYDGYGTRNTPVRIAAQARFRTADD